MRHNIIIILLFSFLLSFSGHVMHNSYMVESKTLIVKFSESYAPKLGFESPVSISDISSIDYSDNFKELLQTNSAKFDDLCAGVNFLGFISMS